MSYQVLARKWRPRRFEEMVGQGHVLQALSNALDSGRIHHAFLFTGTRGVGKTTLARILAKSLNCETGVSARPCGECATCQEIDAGRYVDLLEVDAASRTKVEDTRDLLDNVQYAPTRGRYKIYLIDEVHMLSNHSFNALLKTLEEPPEHVKFLLATTDPQKLPVTILSRCLQFNLRRLHPDLIVEHLLKILQTEQIEHESAALTHLARAADGSMRDALSLMDQAIAYGAGSVKEDDVKQMLGSIEHTFLYQILEALARRDAPELQSVMKQLHAHAPDYDDALSELLSVIHHIAILQKFNDAYDESMGDEGVLRRLAELISAEDVQLFYQIVLNGRRDLLYAPDPVLGFEMTLLRMFAFNVADPVDMSDSGAENERQRTSTTTKPAPATSSTVAKKVSPEAVREEAPAVVTSPGNGSPDWIDLVTAINLQGMLKQLAMNCSQIERQGDSYTLALDPSFENLLTKERSQRLIKEIEAYLGRAVQLDIQVRQAEHETPAMQERREQQARLDAAQQSLEEDKNVKKILDTFGATINSDTIQPVK